MAAVFSTLMPFSTGAFMSRAAMSAASKSLKSEPANDHMSVDEEEEEEQATSGVEDAEGDLDVPPDELQVHDATHEHEGEDASEASSGDEDEAEDEEDHKGRISSRRSTRQRITSVSKRPPRNRSGTASSGSGSSHTDDSTAASSGVEAQWERENPVDGDAEDEPLDPNRCIFCSGTEEEDPGEDFELMLNCAACGDNCHAQCARENEANLPEDADEAWRCPSCLDQQVHGSVSDGRRQSRQSSAARLVRELEPVLGNGKSTLSHTIFENTILDERAGGQGRTLRKRKSSELEDERPHMDDKRQRRASSDVITVSNSGAPAANGRCTDDNLLTPHKRSPGAADATPASRQNRLRNRKPLCSIVAKDEDRLIISFNFGSSTLVSMRDEMRKQKRRERDRARRARQAVEAPTLLPEPEVSHYPALQSTSFFTNFYDLQERDGDNPKAKPYGGILSEAEADTSRTFPQPIDRKKFESARLKAEELWKQKIRAGADPSRQSHGSKASGPPSRIKCIHFGGFEIDTWHSAPYPEEYSRNRVLHVCEFCLKYMSSDFVAWRHRLKCPARHPPGDEIYHDGSFSFFEVDGRKNPVYCQNLCLLAKLFLGSKTLYYDVEPFLFYVMTENDNEGCHFVGYFSKEKRPSSQNNVSCILVLPIHQRRGFGHMLIEFSYLLTRVEGKTGSPEKPLSDMGLVSYRNYWRRILCLHLLEQKDSLSIGDISVLTGMTADDIVCALEGLRALVRDPLTKTYALRLDRPFMKQCLEAYGKKAYSAINPDALMWVPYVMGRDNSHYETSPIQTVVQREEERPGADLDFVGNGNAHSQAVSLADGDEQDQEATPLPELPLDGQSPAFKRQKMVAASTPALVSSGTNEDPIPATRFKVFPPLPGTVKKKLGRPFGTFRSAKRLAQIAAEQEAARLGRSPAAQTPFQTPSTGARSPRKTPGVTPRYASNKPSRRTRSALTISEVAQDEVVAEQEDAEGDLEDEAFQGAVFDGAGSLEDAQGDLEES